MEQYNQYASEKDCEELFLKMHEKVHEKLIADGYRDFRQLGDDWELLKKVYKENAKGPAKHEIGEKIGISKLQEDMENFFYMIKS